MRDVVFPGLNVDRGDLSAKVPRLSMYVAGNSCSSRETPTDAQSSVEDGNAAKKSFGESKLGRSKRMRGGSATVPEKRSLVPSKVRKQASGWKLRRKNSVSSESVMPIDSGSNGSSDISLEVGLKA